MAFSYIGNIFKMRTASLIVIFLICSFNARSQNWAWDSLVNGHQMQRICQFGTSTLYTYTASGRYVEKLDINFGSQFKITFPSQAKVKSVTANDSIFYVFGDFSDSLIMDGHQIYALGLNDMFVAKYSSSGILKWLQGLGSKGNDGGGAICLHGTGFAITGFATDTIYCQSQIFPKPTETALFVARFDSLGSLQNLKLAYSPVGSYGYECASDQNGNLYVLCQHTHNLYIDTVTISQTTSYTQNVLLKFNQLLTLEWYNVVTLKTYYNNAHTLKISPASLVYYIYEDYFWSEIQKIDTQGNSLNTYRFPSQRGPIRRIRDLDLDSCGQIYFIGDQHWAEGYTQKQSYHIAGQLTDSLSANWLRVDSSFNYWKGRHVAAVGDSTLFFAGEFMQGVKINDSLKKAGTGYYFAIIPQLNASPENITPANQLETCEGQNVTLQVSSMALIDWYTDSNASTTYSTGSQLYLGSLAAGAYTFYAQFGQCKLRPQVPVTLTVYPTPEVKIADTAVCFKSTLTLNPSGAGSYTFSSGLPLVQVLNDTSLTIYGANSYGCTDTAICKITVLPLPKIQITSTSNFLCSGMTATITCTGADSFTWSGGALSPSLVISPLANTQYSVHGTALNGCTNSEIYTQFVYDCEVGLVVHPKIKTGTRIYPNPTKGLLFLETDTNSHIELYSSTGLLTLQKDAIPGAFRLNLSDLTPGVYTLLVSGAIPTSHKVIIEPN